MLFYVGGFVFLICVALLVLKMDAYQEEIELNDDLPSPDNVVNFNERRKK